MEQPANFETREWRRLARQASEEKDPEKFIALVERVLKAYEPEKTERPLQALRAQWS
jgi:hypothetical protein